MPARTASRLNVASNRFGVRGPIGGSVPHPVHLDVVRVPVDAVPVVEHHDIGLLLPEDRRQPLGGLIEVGAGGKSRGSSFSSHPVIPESR